MDTDYEAVLIIVGCGSFGIILAVIANLLHVNGVIIDEFITDSITIEDFMAIIVILFLLLGVIVAAVRR